MEQKKKNLNELIERYIKELKIPELEEFLQIYSSLQNFLATTKGFSRKKFACFVEERFQKRKYKGNEEYDEYAAVAKDALTGCFTKWGSFRNNLIAYPVNKTTGRKQEANDSYRKSL